MTDTAPRELVRRVKHVIYTDPNANSDMLVVADALSAALDRAEWAESACAEWAEVSQRNYPRAKKAEMMCDELDAMLNEGTATDADTWNQAIEAAAQWCSGEADKCADSAKWGGSRRYVSDCKAADYALENAAAKIRALRRGDT